MLVVSISFTCTFNSFVQRCLGLCCGVVFSLCLCVAGGGVHVGFSCVFGCVLDFLFVTCCLNCVLLRVGSV